MKQSLMLVGFLSATAGANPTSNTTAADIASLFAADDAIKAYVHNTTLDALKADFLKPTCINDDVTADGTTTADDPQKTFADMLRYIWCLQCREKYDKCMKSWSCWIAPEACSRTCQCDVLKEQPDCSNCGYRC